MRIEYNAQIPNTFHIPARAQTFITYGREDVEALVSYLQTEGQGRRVLHVGAGSNLLFLNDFDGVVLRSDVRELTTYGESVRVGAAWVMDDFIAWTLHHGLYGLENLSLIPGTVGAAAVQNIGAYGVEAADCISEVETLELSTGTIRIWKPEELDYGYRKSMFKKPEVWGRHAVLSVTFRLSRAFTPKLEYGGLNRVFEGTMPTAGAVRDAVIRIRKEKLPDPDKQGNAGSFFMNPVVDGEKAAELIEKYPGMPHYVADGGIKIPAGWMIEQCGWKGRGIGAAGVHDRQALVIVNKGGARGEDIVRLCDAVRKDVENTFGIVLHPEVNFIG